jgi:hypothetical protein
MPEVGEFGEINDVQAWVQIVTDEGSDCASIHVRFPPESAGREFLIVLKGLAQFREFSEPGYPVVTRQCEELPGISEDCQIISGTVPTALPKDPFVGGYCASHAELEVSSLVSLRGRSKAIEATNWAYNTVGSPSIWGGGGNVCSSHNHPPSNRLGGQVCVCRLRWLRNHSAFHSKNDR